MASLGRASAIIGAGTLFSRVTGLVRSVVLVAVIGSFGSKAADAFSVAAMLPTNVYELLAAGVITGILVPQIVKAAAHTDGGSRYVSKLLTLGAVVLVAATALMMALAPVLIWLYAASWGPEQKALATAFAYWLLPQLLFYGLFALLGEVLNARKVFGPYSWAPTVNNIVSIAGFGVFLVVFGGPFTAIGDWDAGMIALLGGTATLGIAMQTVVLLFFWKRTRLHIRPDFGWRGIGLRHVGTLAWWTFLAVVVGQLAGIVQSLVVTQASGEASVTVMVYAWLIFMLPHSIVAMSISTTYFTRLAEEITAGRLDRVAPNLDESIRAIALFGFGFTAAIAAASVAVSRVFTTSTDGAVAMAWVLCGYLIALVPFGVLVIIRRAFFAFQDTRTPFVFSLVQASLAALGAVIAVAAVGMGLLPLGFLAAAVALTQSLSTYVQLPVALRLLRRHTDTAPLRATWRSLGRFTVAAVPAFAAGWLFFLLLGGADGWPASDRLLGAVAGALVGGVALLVYVAALALLRAPELAIGGRMLRRLIGR
ncbi:murein biosynthesis integral membrane protein MurJ [Microbacterium hominis]|uniref:murein biosynthesis integral membrane protein MurJ n=1 Tax=Microbacterium hominis TaxID=162426 RepID=UPI00076877B4|nr:lipid II flippase MurJ [Microbacterium hominis]KXC04828.1 virulence factor MviN [Microbacterium hominis]